MSEYNKWLENIDKLPKHLQESLKNLTEEEKKENFSSNLEFGTGGLRGVVGVGSNKMNEITVAIATQGYANYLQEKYAGEEISIAIAYDNRHFSEEFSKLSASIFKENKIKVYLYEDIAPTPLLSFAVRHFRASGGIMITASHNPKEYNGYKVYDASGAQLNLDDAQNVIESINKVENIFDLLPENYLKVEEGPYLKIVKEDIYRNYLVAIESIAKIQENSRLKIVFTPEHGTSYKIGPTALNHFGYHNIIPVTEQMTPDGDFPATQSANPEEKSAFDLALQYAAREDADLIIATDPDADRLGIYYKAAGEFYPLNGNQTGALLIKYLVDTRKKVENSTIYKTIVTGEAGALYAKEKGFKIVETLTGFKFIGEQIRSLNKKGDFFFGYEESYGYLISPQVRDKDAIQAMILASEMTDYYLKQGKNLGEVLNALYKEVGYFAEETKSMTMSGQDGLAKIQQIMKHFREVDYAGFANLKISKKIDYLIDETGLPKADVLKFYLADLGWLVFRPSGTEPKIKFYISLKGKTVKDAKDKLEEIYSEIMKAIATI